MNGMNALDRLDLDYQSVVNQNVDALVTEKPSAIGHWNQLFSLKRNPFEFEFHATGCRIDVLGEAWSHVRVNVEAARDDCFHQSFEFG